MLSSIALAIRSSAVSSLQEDFDLSERYMEGDKRLRQHIAIERNQTLRKRARDYWYHHLGGLRCIACGFDFGRAYGPLGADFIEMHHDRPLAASPMGRKVGVTDLKPLCSNCHRMVHRRQKGLVSVSHLKALLHSDRAH